MLRKTAEIKTVLKVYNKLKQLRADLIDTAAVMANECVPKNDPIVLKSWKAEDDLLSMYWKLGEYIYKQTGRTAEELNHES